MILGKISCVRDPSFYDNNDHKIIIEDFEKGPKDDNYPRNIYIKNNYFYDLGIYEKQSSAVCLSICSFINILKNTFKINQLLTKSVTQAMKKFQSNESSIVSIHIRLGDYESYQNNPVFWTTSFDSIFNSLEHLNSSVFLNKMM